jgi:hypothetical protein
MEVETAFFIGHSLVDGEHAVRGNKSDAEKAARPRNEVMA